MTGINDGMTKEKTKREEEKEMIQVECEDGGAMR